jgi:phospholipid transport system transporter-binding protein
MIAAPDTIVFETAVAALAALDRGLRAATAAEAIDLAPLARFDSSALAVLLELGRRHGQGRGPGNGAGFELANPPAPLLKLAEVYGVAGLLFGTVEAAQ